MSEWVTQALQWFRQFDWEVVMNPAFPLGMLVTGGLFLLVALALWLKELLFPSFQGVVFAAEKGSLLITPAALQAFVASIVNGFEEVTLRRVRTSRRRGDLCLQVEVDASPEANLAAVTEMMRLQILEACAARLGIAENVKVDLVVVGVETGEAAAGSEMAW